MHSSFSTFCSFLPLLLLICDLVPSIAVVVVVLDFHRLVSRIWLKSGNDSFEWSCKWAGVEAGVATSANSPDCGGVTAMFQWAFMRDLLETWPHKLTLLAKWYTVFSVKITHNKEPRSGRFNFATLRKWEGVQKTKHSLEAIKELLWFSTAVHDRKIWFGSVLYCSLFDFFFENFDKGLLFSF